MTNVATEDGEHGVIVHEIPMVPTGVYYRSFCTCEGFRSRPCGTYQAAVKMHTERHLTLVNLGVERGHQ